MGNPPQPLADRTLRAHARTLAVPTYERSLLRPGVVHFGVGGFHRAHQAVYFDELAERGVSRAWGVVGVNLRHRGMVDALAPQDGLFTVVQRDGDGDHARVVGAMQRQLFAPDDPAAVLGALAGVRLVTLTITGDGYSAGTATTPTVFHYLVEALARGRRSGSPPFTILSCDNVADNGAVTREAVVSFARTRDAVLANWIERNVAFPSSVVDRITPQTTAADRRMVARRFGVQDRWPVVTEPFTQWIVEDSFSSARPPLETVGVRFVPDVRPYKLAKTRLLNASHSALGYLGCLAGHERTDEVMADATLHRYVRGLMSTEIAPLLPPAAGLDLRRYQRTLLARLANPAISDHLARLCARGSTKMPAYVLPSFSEALRRGAPHELLALAVAGWLRYLRGVDEAGRPIEIQDARSGRLRRLARAGGSDPRPVLRERSVFGALGHDPKAVAAVERALGALDTHGVRGAVERTLRAEMDTAA
jgi:mannitol-1-phosphate/altronate dehydrogenase